MSGRFLSARRTTGARFGAPAAGLVVASVIVGLVAAPGIGGAGSVGNVDVLDSAIESIADEPAPFGYAMTIETADGSLEIVHVDALDDAADTGVAALDTGGQVVAIDTDRPVGLLGHPNDPFSGADYAYETHQLESAWPITTGTGVTVAVIDTGIDSTHPDLSGSLLPGYTFLGGNGSAGGVPGCAADPHSHGTHVAGIIAAHADNASHTYGIAPGVQLLPVCALDSSGSGYFSDIAAGVIWAVDNGADVINMSLGAPGSSISYVEAAFAYAAANDVVLVVAAGNDGTTVPAVENYPASSSYVVAVAAVQTSWLGGSSYSYSTAYFSNRYPGVVDLAADGSSVNSLVPLWMSAGGVGTKSGTSMAAPAAAATIALVRGALPSLTAAQVVALVESTALDINTAGRDDETGYGLPQVYAAIQAGGSTAPTTTTTAAPTTTTPPTTAPPTTAAPPTTVPTPAPAPSGSRLTMVPSRRVYDSRSIRALPAGETVQVDTGMSGTAVAMNVTAISGASGGYLTAFAPPPGVSCPASAPPATSTVNFAAHEVRAAAAVVNITAGRLCVFTSAPVDVLVDISGFLEVGTGAGLVLSEPRRLADSRTADRIGGNSVLRVPLPAHSAAVQLNVTAVEPLADTYLTVYPSRDGVCDPAARPDVSNLNVAKGSVRPNVAIIDGSDGSVCVYSSAPTHVLVDLAGSFSTSSSVSYSTQVPSRVIDTRSGRGPLRGDGVVSAVPSDSATGIVAVQANVTAIGGKSPGFVTAYRCDGVRPGTSNVNFAGGEVSPNGGAIAISSAGLCLYTSSEAHLLLDITGYWRS